MGKKKKTTSEKAEPVSPISSASPAAPEVRSPAVEYVHTAAIPDLLRTLGASLIVTTYQAQRILAFSVREQRLSMLMRIFIRPTGLTIDRDRMALVTRREIFVFRSTLDVWDESGNRMPYDLTYAPRYSYITGDVAGHEIAFLGNDLVFINTRFSCLARPSTEFSFEPIWKPRFISSYAAEDRCHLNGMAVEGTQIRYVTALGETDTKEGWRENKAKGGVLIDVASGESVCRELSMPHSPRLHAGKLWVLESGMGELQVVDPASGVRQTVCRLPGYCRGLTFFDRFAFVGLSLMREKKTFGGLPIETMYPKLRCGIAVVDITRGVEVAFIEFTKGIEELFDVRLLPGVLNPHIIGFEEETINGLFIVPPTPS